MSLRIVFMTSAINVGWGWPHLLSNYTLSMNKLKRAKIMLGIVAFRLFMSGVTVWPAVSELKMAVRMVWGDGESAGVLHSFILQAIEWLESVEENYSFM